MTLDDNLVKTVDRVARETKTTRSAFTREALRLAIRRLQARQLEQKHRLGYAGKPVAKGEFDVWTKEQAWGEK
ncbi:MAG: ribbon-helix-helix domain-containing protein [Kiritimatiellae bacterium]|jgi:metal-responsive CopG/Arc/MetJ family transcriptional regulator|nr:ribbon-helix-helix domain-containing protein [Kiritimatiellia bacterium]